MRLFTESEIETLARSEGGGGGTVTIGNFDGIHLGHQALLRRAQVFPGPHTVITFDPHPVQVLFPERGLKRLFPREDLIQVLPQYGVDILLLIAFTREFSRLSPAEFLENYVWAPFRPRHIVAGYDFNFGKGREGTLAGLNAWAEMRNKPQEGRSIRVEVVEALKWDGEVVSSRGIRELLAQGNVAQAARQLGRPFYLRGKIMPGARRGRALLNAPTLNMEPVNETLPARGVYVTRTRFDGRCLSSVTNIGLNPTFAGENSPAPSPSELNAAAGRAGARIYKVETHVLDGECNPGEMSFDVEFIDYLRPEIRFPTIEDLKKQIQSDILKAREILKGIS